MNIQAIHGVGLIFGMMGFAMLADKRGRKYAFMVSQYTITLAIGSIFWGIMMRNPFLMGMGQFLNGLTCIVNVNLSFTIAC